MECNTVDCDNPAWKTYKCVVEVEGKEGEYDVNMCEVCYWKQKYITPNR